MVFVSVCTAWLRTWNLMKSIHLERSSKISHLASGFWWFFGCVLCHFFVFWDLNIFVFCVFWMCFGWVFNMFFGIKHLGFSGVCGEDLHVLKPLR